MFTWIKKLFIKTPKSIFVIDGTDEKPYIRCGFVKSIKNKGSKIIVRIPSLGNRIFECEWKDNNYHIIK